jgi:hypothetical protein
VSPHAATHATIFRVLPVFPILDFSNLSEKKWLWWNGIFIGDFRVFGVFCGGKLW